MSLIQRALDAITNRKPHKLKKVLSEGLSPDAVAPSHYSLLIEAMQAGNEECVAVLLEAGANPDAVCGSKGIIVTPMTYAIQRNLMRCCQWFLQGGKSGKGKKSNPNFTSPGGLTLLHLAAGTGSKELCQLLLAAGANASINAVNQDGATPLLAVVHTLTPRDDSEETILTIVDLLLNAGADQTVNCVLKAGQDCVTALTIAARGNLLKVCQRLVAAKASVDVDGQTESALHAALMVIPKNFALINLFFDRMSREHVRAILQFILERDDVELLQFFLTKRQIEREFFLSQIEKYDSPRVRRAFLTFCGSKSVEDLSASKDAAAAASPPPPPQEMSATNSSSESEASDTYYGEEETRIMELIEAGDISGALQLLRTIPTSVYKIHEDYGLIPALSAIDYNSMKMLQALRQHGIHLNVISGNAETPLYHAVGHGTMEMVRYLLQEKADPNLVDADCPKYPLVKAAKFNADDVMERVSILLQHGADPKSKDRKGKCAFDYALENQNAEVVATLCDLSDEVQMRQALKCIHSSRQKQKSLLILRQRGYVQPKLSSMPAVTKIASSAEAAAATEADARPLSLEEALHKEKYKVIADYLCQGDAALAEIVFSHILKTKNKLLCSVFMTHVPVTDEMLTRTGSRLEIRRILETKLREQGEVKRKQQQEEARLAHKRELEAKRLAEESRQQAQIEAEAKAHAEILACRQAAREEQRKIREQEEKQKEAQALLRKQEKQAKRLIDNMLQGVFDTAVQEAVRYYDAQVRKQEAAAAAAEVLEGLIGRVVHRKEATAAATEMLDKLIQDVADDCSPQVASVQPATAEAATQTQTGVQPVTRQRPSFSSLHQAVFYNATADALRLIAEGRQRINRYTISYAAFHANVRVLRALLERVQETAQPMPWLAEAFCYAGMWSRGDAKYIDATRELLAQYGGRSISYAPYTHNENDLHIAVRFGDTAKIYLYMHYPKVDFINDVSEHGFSPLVLAAAMDRVDLCDYMLQLDKETRQCVTLDHLFDAMVAALNYVGVQSKAFQYFKGLLLNSQPHMLTLLDMAYQKQQMQIVSVLLAEGPVNEADADGRTPLDWMIEKRNDLGCKLLLARNVDVRDGKYSMALAQQSYAAQRASNFPEAMRCKQLEKLIVDRQLQQLAVPQAPVSIVLQCAQQFPQRMPQSQARFFLPQMSRPIPLRQEASAYLSYRR